MSENQFKLPTWYWIVAVVLIIWNLMGVASFVAQVFSPETVLKGLTGEELAFQTKTLNNYPVWAKIGYGVAVFSASLGSVFLFLRSKYAKELFAVSLLGMLINMTYTMPLMPEGLQIYGPGIAISSAVIFLVGVLELWFSNSRVKRGWLR